MPCLLPARLLIHRQIVPPRSDEQLLGDLVFPSFALAHLFGALGLAMLLCLAALMAVHAAPPGLSHAGSSGRVSPHPFSSASARFLNPLSSRYSAIRPAASAS